MTWAYLITHKSDVCDLFKDFYMMVQTQFKTSIQVLRSGGKYVNHRLVTLFKTHGIIHQTSCPHSPQQNGVAERKNHHLLEVTRSLLIDQHVPHYLWGEALYSAVYLINRVPSRIVQFQTPLEALTSHHEVPSVLHIPPGCIAFFQNHAHQRSKLDPCALKCVFVGHSSSQKGYKSYHPPSRKFYVTMDLTFQEDTPYYLPSPSFQGERQLIEEKSDKDPSFLPMTIDPQQDGDRAPPPRSEPHHAAIDPQEHGNHGDQSPPNEASTMPPSPTPLAQSTPEESTF